MKKILIILAMALAPHFAFAEDMDAKFAEFGDLPESSINRFEYALSLQALTMQGSIRTGHRGGVLTESTQLRLRGASPKRIPGDASMSLAEVRITPGFGIIDMVVTREHNFIGKPIYPPDKPAAMFRAELRKLLLVNNEAHLRIRFKDSTDYYVLRYAIDKGLRLEALSRGQVQADADSLPDFRIVTHSENDLEWSTNPLSTWATQGDELLWATDVPIEGQPDRMRPVGDLLLITTTADHSFYIVKDTGEIVFYEKSILPGKDPIGEVVTLGRRNMLLEVPHRSLARYITGIVLLDDRRAIPFLIDCVEAGDGLPTKAMAIAALEKFNGNPLLWAPEDWKPGDSHLGWVGMDRVYPDENRDAEIARWKEVFADELDDDAL